MTRQSLLAATALGLVLAAGPAIGAAMVVTNPISDLLSNIISSIQKAAILTVDASINAMGELQNTTLIAGFNQMTNYLKGQTASVLQITDASNTANATFTRSVRNADIAARHAVSPAACLALDGGRTIATAAMGAGTATVVLSGVSDERGEGAPATPAYAGVGQAAEAGRAQHLSRYCSRIDVEAGLCGVVSQLENADQRALTLYGSATYADQDRLTAAKDYALTLVQPIPMSPLRADQRKGLSGAQLEGDRRNHNARMSVAATAVNTLVSWRTATVSLTTQQQAQQRAMGRAPTATGSLYEATELEVLRRHGNDAWNVALERMPTADVLLRELSRQMAFQAHLTWADMKLRMLEIGMTAGATAADARRDYERAIQIQPSMPIPLAGVSN